MHPYYSRACVLVCEQLAIKVSRVLRQNSALLGGLLKAPQQVA